MYLIVHRLLQRLEGVNVVRRVTPPPPAFAALAALAPSLAALAAPFPPAASGYVGVRVTQRMASTAAVRAE